MYYINRYAWLFVALLLAVGAAPVDAGVVHVAPGQTYTAQCADDLVVLDAAANVTLPSAKACAGKRITVKKGDQSSSISSVNAAAGETIEHSPSLKLQISGDGLVAISDGTRWHTETQYVKSRPYSHRTVTYASTNGGGWNLDICRDNAEVVRVWANESPSGIGIYLPPANG